MKELIRIYRNVKKEIKKEKIDNCLKCKNGKIIGKRKKFLIHLKYKFIWKNELEKKEFITRLKKDLEHKIGNSTNKLLYYKTQIVRETDVQSFGIFLSYFAIMLSFFVGILNIWGYKLDLKIVAVLYTIMFVLGIILFGDLRFNIPRYNEMAVILETIEEEMDKEPVEL